MLQKYRQLQNYKNLDVNVKKRKRKREQSYKDARNLSRKFQSRRDNRTTEVIFITRPIYPRSVEGDKKTA